MARGTTLLKLLDQLRAEARLSPNPAHNVQVRDSHVILLQREQERLWEDFNWPHLRVERILNIEIGQRFYTPPADLSIDRIESIQVKSDGEWFTLRNGIGAPEYFVHDSAIITEKAWPITAWRISEENLIEIWPIADTRHLTSDFEGLKIIGIRNLKPLVENGDRADLDDRLLTLYVAAGLLAAAGAKDAQLKIEAANRHYAKLKGSQQKTQSFRMFGTDIYCGPVRPVITRYRPAGS